MPPRKKKPRRRRKAKISLINTVTSLAVLNSWSNASAGMGLVPFFTDGWFGRKPSASSDNSWEVSLYEMTQTMLGNSPAGSVYGSTSYSFTDAIKKNFKDNGGTAIATTLLLPIAVTVGSKIARKQINMVNRLAAPIMKPLGVKL